MKRKLLILCGTLSFAMGIVGIFFPILPTTPFLLLAATCYFHSSKRLYQWLTTHPRFGQYILNFREHRAVPLRVKIVSVSLLWITLLCCTVFTTDELWLRILYMAIAIGVTWHILSYKTCR